MIKLHQEKTGSDVMQETEKFERKVDAFFDCLNVRDTDTGHRKRKPNLFPYTKPTDPRFKVSIYEYMHADIRLYSIQVCMHACRNSATS